MKRIREAFSQEKKKHDITDEICSFSKHSNDLLWCIDDNVLDKSKELLYKKIKLFTSTSKSVTNYIKVNVTNISNNIIKQYYGIT